MRKNPHLGENFGTYLQKKLKDPEHRKGYELARARLRLQLKIQELAKQKKLSIRQLAKRMGTSGTQIQRLLDTESDKDFRLGTLIGISQALGKELVIDFR
jgi:DNA-binding Xre family transcriptional regulator